VTDSLFPDIPESATPAREEVSAGRRLTLRQCADVAAGRHPLTGGRLTSDPDARCGNCRFRELLGYHKRRWPKCTVEYGREMTHGAATDVRAWWPGCTLHEWGDPKLSPDAARSRPPAC